ncbi:MAG: acyl-CoA dehydratase activase-related protein [Bacilli bacterium]|nr:acyl-CoA dehydratase activase-related protein [Bacilli bacterium]MDD4808918.1 acyl-CoA dehydratase activase-related protein [Bacilli bacterium]
MDEIKIGIPRGLYYYYDGFFLTDFFKRLGFEVIVSIETNRELINQGNYYASDEMCLSLKTYLGHVAYLKDKCDYLLLMRIDNYGLYDQMCTNFASLYDIVNNLFDLKIIDINIDEKNKQNMLKELIKIGKQFGFKKSKIIETYKISQIKSNKYIKRLKMINNNKLKSNNLKILMVSHPYNLEDRYIGYSIIQYLEEMKIEIVYSYLFDHTNGLSKQYSNNLYWKYSKESIGAIELVKDRIDGVIFISSFPCGPDSLVNELVIRKMNLPYLNLILDDINSLTGTITRLESFIDILYAKS